MIDSHTHLDDSAFDGPLRSEILDNLSAGKVAAVINAACDLKSMLAGAQLAHCRKNVFFTVGCHPHEAKTYDKGFESQLIESARDDKAVAVGEIGLDYHYDLSERQTQREVFSRQLGLASEMRLPVVLHIREAWRDALEILERFKRFPDGLLLHCYSGSLETARILSEKYDAYFAFGGAITFKNFGGAEVVRGIPTNRILTETDCPYLTPEPFRGKINRPEYVAYVLKKLADIKNISFEEAEKITESNALAFFKKIPSGISN